MAKKKKKKLLRLTQFEIENLNRLLTKIDSVINFFSQTTVIRWLHWWTLPNVSGRNKNPSQNISKNRKEPILKGPYYSDAKSRHMRVCKVASVVSDSATPWTVTYQAPPSMGFSRQEYWSGLPNFIPQKGWAPKNWSLQTVVLEKTLGNPLDSKEIQPVNPKGNQLWIFIGRTDAEA